MHMVNYKKKVKKQRILSSSILLTNFHRWLCKLQLQSSDSISFLNTLLLGCFNGHKFLRMYSFWLRLTHLSENCLIRADSTMRCLVVLFEEKIMLALLKSKKWPVSCTGLAITLSGFWISCHEHVLLAVFLNQARFHQFRW